MWIALTLPLLMLPALLGFSRFESWMMQGPSRTPAARERERVGSARV